MKYSDEIIAIVPARSGSVGIKDKNIKVLCGYPLMAYSIVAAKMCNAISRVIVSTDSKKYAEIAKEYGAEVPFLRPSSISGSKAEDIEYLKYTLLELEKREGYIPKYVVLLRPTTPGRNVEVINDAIAIIKTGDYTALSSVIENDECPYKWVKIDEKKHMKALFNEMSIDDINKPRQGFPKTYYPDGYIEILNSKIIVQNNRMYGDKVFPLIVDKSVDIDNEEDFENAKKLIEKSEVFKYFEMEKKGRRNNFEERENGR